MIPAFVFYAIPLIGGLFMMGEGLTGKVFFSNKRALTKFGRLALMRMGALSMGLDCTLIGILGSWAIKFRYGWHTRKPKINLILTQKLTPDERVAQAQAMQQAQISAQNQQVAQAQQASNLQNTQAGQQAAQARAVQSKKTKGPESQTVILRNPRQEKRATPVPQTSLNAVGRQSINSKSITSKRAVSSPSATPALSTDQKRKIIQGAFKAEDLSAKMASSKMLSDKAFKKAVADTEAVKKLAAEKENESTEKAKNIVRMALSQDLSKDIEKKKVA